MDPSQKKEIKHLNSLVKLRKVTITGNSNVRTAFILRQLPRHIHDLCIETEPDMIETLSLTCPICGITGLRDFVNLVELDISVHILGARRFLFNSPVYPRLERLRLNITLSPCPSDNDHTYFVGNPVLPIFPQLKELVLEWVGLVTASLIIGFVGKELRSLSMILLCGYDEMGYLSSMIREWDFPKLESLSLTDGDRDELQNVFKNADIQVGPLILSSGPRRWNYRSIYQV